LSFLNIKLTVTLVPFAFLPTPNTYHILIVSVVIA
jgi:hypothetical protein